MLFSLLTFALFASAITANKIIFYSLPASLLVAIRMLLGGFILYIYTRFNLKNRLNFIDIKNNFNELTVITLFTNFFPALLKAYSLKNLPSGNMAFFGSLDPFITAILSYFLLKEKLSKQKILGIFIGFLGSLILIIDKLNFKILIISLPEIAIILSLIISRFGWIKAQKLLKSNKFNPIQLNVITMLSSGILSLILSILLKETFIKSLKNVKLDLFNYKLFKYIIDIFGFNGLLLFFILYTTVIGNVIAYNCYGYLLKKHSSVYISVLGFSIPIFVNIFGILFLNEKLSLQFIFASLVTFLGLIVFFKEEIKL